MKKSSIKPVYAIVLNNPFVLFFLLVTLCFSSFGQVGINTTTPFASLDIKSSNQATPSNTDGILIPKVDNFSIVNPTAAQNGMLIFVTGNGTPNKGFYYWNNATNTWILIAGTTNNGLNNTLDQAYDQGGLGLGKNIDATDGAVRINGEDGVLVTGTFGTGDTIDTEITGNGTRMFFNPNKAAFRAGIASGNRWDDINIGAYSTALGNGTMASGIGSLAFGNGTTASENNTTAFGANTLASGNSSLAFGTFTIASGNNATAFGYGTNASQTGSTAFGDFTTASGNYATAFGAITTASGNYSTAFGNFNVASGDFSTVFGDFNTASQQYATAFGFLTQASGYGSTAFGFNTVSSNYGSTAFGQDTIASGFSATAFGVSTQSSGYGSVAFGNGSQAIGDGATAFGGSSAIGHGSTAFGGDTIATGGASTAFGISTIASGTYSTAFGVESEASEYNATAFGLKTKASGYNATVFGVFTEASGYNATAFGASTIASGNYSTTFGTGTIAPSYSEIAIGTYNTIYTPINTDLIVSNSTDRLFTIGNGFNSTMRSNALTIYKHGLMNINDEYDMPLVDGTINQVMTTNGAGVVSFQDANTLNGNTLDEAYDEGGPGLGRAILADNGAVAILGNGGLRVESANQNYMLFVDGANDAVGINTALPTATLSVNGSANKPGGGTWAVFSDERLKENISNYSEGLNLIKNIRPVNFSYNDKIKVLIGKNQSIDKRIYQGVIAQELQEIAPDMVQEVGNDSSNSFLEVDPNKFTYALINAVKEQQEMIDKLQDKTKHLETQLKKQQKEFEAIKAFLKI